MEVKHMQFPPCPTNNRVKCCVPGCRKSANKHPTLRFHRIPKAGRSTVTMINHFGEKEQIDRKAAWLKILKYDKNVSDRTVVCSLHFKEEDYFPSPSYPDFPVKFRKLKLNVVPSLNLTANVHTKEVQRKMIQRNFERSERIKHREEKKSTKQYVETNIQVDCDMDNKVNNKKQQNNLERTELPDVSKRKQLKIQVVEPLIPKVSKVQNDVAHQDHDYAMIPSAPLVNTATTETKNANNKKENSRFILLRTEPLASPMTTSFVFKNVGIQGASLPVTPKFKDVGIQCNSIPVTPICKEAGIQANIEYTLCDYIKNDSELKTATGIKTFQVLNTIVELIKRVHGDKFEKINIKMDTKTRVVMTYVKLKQNISYSFLAIMFNNYYTPLHCKRVFFETVKVLSECLTAVAPIPIKDKISEKSIVAANQRKIFKILEPVMPVELEPIVEDILTIIYATMEMGSCNTRDSEKS